MDSLLGIALDLEDADFIALLTLSESLSQTGHSILRMIWIVGVLHLELLICIMRISFYPCLFHVIPGVFILNYWGIMCISIPFR